MNLIERIKAVLTERLQPERLDVIDDSHKHVGHAGAKGGGHFRVVIVSPAFEGKSLIGRHRLVYEALVQMMRKDIHALSINAKTPAEAAKAAEAKAKSTTS